MLLVYVCLEKLCVLEKMYIEATNYICRNCRVLAVLRKRCCEQLSSLDIVHACEHLVSEGML